MSDYYNFYPTRDGLENVVAGLGTNRDKRSFSYWASPRKLNAFELTNMYRCSWLAKKIIDAPADDMTREWVQLHFSDTDTDTQFALEKAVKDFCVKAKLNEAMKWARLYGGAAVFIATNEADLKRPLNPASIRRGQLLHFHVIECGRLSHAGILNRDIRSDDLGKPEFYRIEGAHELIHRSRFVFFDGAKIPIEAWRYNNFWHDSMLQHVYDSLTDCESAVQSVASMMFEASLDILKIKDLSNELASPQGEKKIRRRFETAMLMKSINRTLLLDEGDEYSNKQLTFSNLDKIIDKFMVNVSGAADIPVTRLFGQSAAGLNATGENDIKNYYDMIRSKQESELRPGLEKLLSVLAASTLGRIPGDLDFEFRSLWQMSATDKATIEKTQAERDKVYYDMGALEASDVVRDLLERKTYPNLTEEDAEELEEAEEASEKKDLLNPPIIPVDPFAQPTPPPPPPGAPKKAKPGTEDDETE